MFIAQSIIHTTGVVPFQQKPQVQQQMIHHLVALNVEFSEQYRVAKEMYAHCIFDEIQQHSLFYRSASSENTVFSGNFTGNFVGNHTVMIPF